MFTDYPDAATAEKGEADIKEQMDKLDAKVVAYKQELAVTQARMIAIKQRSERHAENSAPFREMAQEGRQLIKAYRDTSMRITAANAVREQLRAHLSALSSKLDISEPIGVIARTTPLLQRETMSQDRLKSVLTEATKQQAAITDNQAALIKIMNDAAARADTSATMQADTVGQRGRRVCRDGDAAQRTARARSDCRRHEVADVGGDAGQEGARRRARRQQRHDAVGRRRHRRRAGRAAGALRDARLGAAARSRQRRQPARH